MKWKARKSPEGRIFEYAYDDFENRHHILVFRHYAEWNYLARGRNSMYQRGGFFNADSAKRAALRALWEHEPTKQERTKK